MANELNFHQCAAILNSINSQVTGHTTIAPVNTKDFISVAQTTLATGYDPVIQSISQILGRTIFSSRAYTGKFGGIEASNQRYGAITRKINYLDSEAEDDKGFDLPDQGTVDQYSIRKGKVLQTNFYGSQIHQRGLTILIDQLDSAMTGPDQFGEFISGLLRNLNNQVEQDKESAARLTIGNFMTGVKDEAAAADQVIHLLTEYNAVTGLQLDATTVMAPDNFPAFMQWVYGRIAGLSSMITERSEKYHFNLDSKPIKRHTPMDDQRVYLYAPTQYMYNSRVLADTYHDSFINFSDFHPVNYWQSIDKPDEVKIQPTYFDHTTGGTKNAAGPVSLAKVFGCIFDREALGYSVFNKKALASPVNARGRYHNLWYNYNIRWWNDFTENFILLLLD